jgi:hypothetical protein
MDPPRGQYYGQARMPQSGQERMEASQAELRAEIRASQD